MFLFEDYYDINQSTAVCKSFSIPLGVSEDGKLEEHHLSEEDGASLLVSGFCGSGKSNYIHSLINATLLQYSSAQVNIWLYAYKECEYQVFLNSSIPHLTRNWIGHEDHAKEAFILALEKEMDARQQMFMRNGITNYNHDLQTAGNAHLPQLVVIIEDFDLLIRDLFAVDYSYRYRLDKLLRTAHMFGILLVFSVQDVFKCEYLTAIDLSKHIALRQSSEAIMAQFKHMNTVRMAHTLTVGEAIIDIPAVHKVNLLYVSPETEQKIITLFQS